MKNLLLIVALLSIAADSTPKSTPTYGLDEFAAMFLLADKMEKAATEATQSGQDGEALGFHKSAAMVREEIATLRALRRKQPERASRP